MSIQEPPPPSLKAPGSQGTADGSPPGGAARDEGMEADPSGGAEPSGDGGEGNSTAADTSALQRELDEAREELDRNREAWSKIDQDPKLSKRVLARLKNESEGAEEDGPVASVIGRFWPKTTRAPDEEVDRPNPWNTAISELTAAIRQELRAEYDSKLTSRLAGVDSNMTESRFQRALTRKGVDLETQDSREFRAFEKELARTNKLYRVGKTKSPEDAADLLSLQLSQRKAARTGNQYTRQTLDDAKNARLNGNSPRGGQTAKRQFVYDPRDPRNSEKLTAYFEAGGTKEGVVRKK